MWVNLVSRPSGQFGLRFLIQPAMATILAIRDGLKDARTGRTPYLWTIVARPEKRGAALATVAIGLSASSVFGVPLGTWVGHALGWHATFWMIALITLAGVAAMSSWGLPASGDSPNAVPSLAVRIAPLGRARIWVALLPCLLMYIATAIVFTYIALLLGTRYSSGDLPALLVVYGLGGLAGSQLGGRLADRLGPLPPIFIGLSCLTAVQLLMPFSLGSVVATCAILFGATLFSWGCFAPLQSRLIQLEPNNANVVIALINTGVYLGNAIGATIGGVLLRFIPVTDLPFAAALVSALALAVLSRPLPRDRIAA